MEPQSWRKVLQKKVYDIISHRYGLLVIIVGAILIVVSALHFGESVAEWSTEKYAAVFNSFSDNLAGRSYRERLCLPVPIDVVYTWVNGTDPELIMNLKRLKLEMEDQLNVSRRVKCVFRNCIPIKAIVLDPMLPQNMTLAELGESFAPFLSATKMFRVMSPIDRKNLTAVVFEEEEKLLAVMNKTFIIDHKNTSVIRCHITSDAEVMNGIQLTDQIIMSGFPHTLNTEELRTKLPKKLEHGIEQIDMYSDRGIAVLHVPVKEQFDALLAESNFTIDGKKPTFNPANLVWDLRDFSRDGDISASRFEDNEELRYSLRSLEQFAPWVRHIYIITNGQIPYWLNLEYSRVTVVTHDEIFANLSHLPSFGSPAIESNIHRIPGLSDKFIYMNDDVMFGKDVWPDDFFTHSSGQKVYLTWPVPNCNEGCPSSWLRDGYCDKACNVSECEWDAGDCDGVKGHQLGGWAGVGYQGDTGYCNTGCANNWIADRYCDTACNVLECAFDAGDCGTDRFGELYHVTILSNTTNYVLPKGVFQCYFNLSTLLQEPSSSIQTAQYDDNSVIRTIAIAKKFKVLTVALFKDFNATQFNFTLDYGKGNHTQELNFTLAVDTYQVKTVPVVVNETKAVNITAQTNNTIANKTEEEEEEKVSFIDIPLEQELPRAIVAAPGLLPVVENMPSNLSAVPFPPLLKSQFLALRKELNDSLLTETAYQRRLMKLWVVYKDYLQRNQSRALKAAAKLAPNNTRFAVRKLLNVWDLEMEMEENKAINVDKSFMTDVDIQPETGKLLPWERGILGKLQEETEKKENKIHFEVLDHQGRHLLDTFADSLHHVNKLYNKAFGYSARRVPGHMPHMIDRNIMTELHDKFPEEWAATSAHKIRHSKDMQFAFSYFYYLMGVKENVTAAKVFDDMDTDKSRILSDREIRTLATRLYELPLDLQTLTKIEFTFVNCSRNISSRITDQPDATMLETYYEHSMPQVTRNLFINCPEVQAMVKKHFPPQNKYKHVVMDDADIAFKMIKTNVSIVVGQLDDVRKHPKKFICLNDNIDHNQDQAKTVKAILQDFYESVFPIQSQFELPREYRNRFTHIQELREWRRYRDWLKFWTHIALVLLVVFTVASYFGDKIEAAQRRFSRRRTTNETHDNSSSSSGGVTQTV